MTELIEDVYGLMTDEAISMLSISKELHINWRTAKRWCRCLERLGIVYRIEHMSGHYYIRSTTEAAEGKNG
jgi:predicted transcriptional regulator